MRVRLFLAPAWVRWLVLAAVIALLTGPIFAFTAPLTVDAMGWRWGLLVLTCFGLITGGLVQVLHQPLIDRYNEALGDLGTPQRVQAVKALRTGEVPADSAVLAAAIRVGDLNRAFARRARQQRVVMYGLPAFYACLALVDVVIGAVSQGVAWAALAVVFAGSAAWSVYVGKRWRRNLPVFRTAAGLQPDEPSGTVDTAAASRRRPVLIGIALFLVMVSTMTLVYLAWGRPRQADCRTVGLMTNEVAEDPGLVDARRITPGGPALESYRAWSSRIDEYARQVSAPDLGPKAQLVSSAAEQAVAIVEDARTAPVDDSAVDRQQAAYQEKIGQIVGAENDLIALCRLTRN